MQTHTAKLTPQPARLRVALATLAAAALLSACATGPKTAAPTASPPVYAPAEAFVFGAETAPAVVPCPAFTGSAPALPAGAQCLRGKDSAGAPYFIVKPATWSGVLVVHAHGGPFLGAPTDGRANEDIQRWSIVVRQGHAYAASVFRQGGFAVTTAAQDTERVRQIFISHVAKPKTTLLHGQSWGAMVASRAAELYPKSWDGVLLTSGVVAGAATYDFRVDLRALYQHLCQNNPRPTEAQYPLHLGQPAGAAMTAAEVTARVNECLALNKPAAQRTAEQRAKAKLLADVVRIPESSIQSHLNWGTSSLADVTRRHGGAPIGNAGVRYSGTGSPEQDAQLNAALDRQGLRFAADPAARAKFLADVEHSGRFAVPVLTAHGINDATVFVEGSDTLRQRMQAAGNGPRLVQTFVNSDQHSYWGDASYPPLFNALLQWVTQGKKPTPYSIAAQCANPLITNSAATAASAAPTTGKTGLPSLVAAAAQADKSECLFLPNYNVKPLASRIPAR